MTSPVPASSRGRPRDPGAADAIISAALSLLIEAGIQGVTMRAIADRAGVGRQTIYRRWASKESLLTDVLALYAEQQTPLPDTGDVRRDLREYLTEVVTAMATPTFGGVTEALVAAAAQDDHWRDLGHDIQARRRAITRQLVTRASQRGELPDDTDADLLLDMLHGPLYMRLLVSGAPLTSQLVEPLVDAVLAAPPRRARRDG